MPDTIAELRRLLAEATPGPWLADYSGDVLPAAYADDELGCTILIAGESLRATRQRQEADVAVVTAAVNALPALLDVAEAARAMDRDFPDHTCNVDLLYGVPCTCDRDGRDKRHNALRAFVKKLEAL